MLHKVQHDVETDIANRMEVAQFFVGCDYCDEVFVGRYEPAGASRRSAAREAMAMGGERGGTSTPGCAAPIAPSDWPPRG